MDKLNFFIKSLNKDWYTQGFNAVPIFLNHSAWSGFIMKKELGYGYSSFTHNYKNGYGEMSYLTYDFKGIWKIVKDKLKNNPGYLKSQKKRYEEIFKKHEIFFKKIDKTNLSKITEEELIDIFKKCAQAQTDSVGIAHLADTIGIEIENEFKNKLFSEIAEKDRFNYYFAELTAPSKMSFVAKEELGLKKITSLPKNLRAKKLKEHTIKYFWLYNSYAGPKKLGIKFFKGRIDKLRLQKRGRNNRKSIINKLNLSLETRKIIEIIDFTTIWQDERKAKILKTIGYFGKIIEEIAKRAKIPIIHLYYFGVKDVENIKSLKDIISLKNELKSRISGAFFLMQNGREHCISGRDYKEFIKAKEKMVYKLEKGSREIHGSIANRGTAIGKVLICRGTSSLDKVQKGDILVASMTRPEFMPALKRAAAVVTDEGGITCHAAIVSRELNIPCIIGTKVATRVLKNGMLIEVKANHGVVKILK